MVFPHRGLVYAAFFRNIEFPEGWSWTTGCWMWRASQVDGGYSSRFRKSSRAHRWSYEEFIGPIPAGLTLDHLCRQRLCVNPSHLEPVTRAENTRRASAPRCEHGHAIVGKNALYRKENGQLRWPRCRICQCRTQHRRYRESVGLPVPERRRAVR